MRVALLFAIIFMIAGASAGSVGFEGDGPQWVILDVVTSESTVIVDAGLVFSGAANLLLVGWDEDNIYSGTEESGFDVSLGADLRSPLAEGSLVLFGGFGGTADNGLILSGAGHHRALFIFAGEVTNWVIIPGAGIQQIEILAQGIPRTIETDDWNGPAHARLAAGPTVEAAVARTLTFDVEDTLTGWFFEGGLLGPGAGSMRLLLPDGVERDCFPPGWLSSPCHFPNPDYPLGGPAGTYTSTYTGALASDVNTPGFVVADVPLWDFP